MKTRTHGLIVRAENSENEEFFIEIQTPRDGQLMTNRLRSLLRDYGDRVEVPNALVLELTEGYIKKSRSSKSTKKNNKQLLWELWTLRDVLDELGDAINTLVCHYCDDQDDIEFLEEDIENLRDIMSRANYNEAMRRR